MPPIPPVPMVKSHAAVVEPKATIPDVYLGDIFYPSDASKYHWDLQKSTNGITWVPVLTNYATMEVYYYTNIAHESPLYFRAVAHR